MEPSVITEINPEQAMYIGGSWCASSEGSTIDCINPATEQRVARIPDATEDDVERAVQAASDALPVWRAMPAVRRADLLYQLADAIAERREELARLDTIDSGNPLRAMADDVSGACREVRLFAGLATEMKGASVSDGNNRFAYALREPYGVVGRIIPFNHPFKFAAGKTAAALVAGNTVVLKPSEHTSLSAIRLAEISSQILPRGTFNVVTGRGARAGAAIAAHPGIPRVAFTGGLTAGRAVLRAGADTIKHVSLELGGKNPMIVFPDADPATAARAAVAGMNLARSQGQSCQSNSRILVHAEVHQAFLDELLGVVSALRVGDPLELDTDIGPLAFREHFDRVRRHIATGKAEGAHPVTADGAERSPGLFVNPVVFDGVSATMALAREEIFGPVLSVIRWTDYEAMIRLANDTPYGLTANIWTRDLAMAHYTAARIEAGYVWINGSGKRVFGTPFGGYKHSGIGKEGSLEEVLGYTRHKVVAVGLPGQPGPNMNSSTQHGGMA
jgi:betaine-aldehyde dehydrogenase